MEKLSDERLTSIRNDGESGGTFAAADVLSMIGEIIYSRKRIAELLNAYRKLEADARVSQEFQRDVLMPLFDQLEKAGFSGTWSQKVDAVIALKEATRWITNDGYNPEEGDLCDVIPRGWHKRTIGYWYWDNDGDHENPKQDYQQWFALNLETVGFEPLDEPPQFTRPMNEPLPPESEGK
jgi:hypothetical protein